MWLYNPSIAKAFSLYGEYGYKKLSLVPITPYTLDSQLADEY